MRELEADLGIPKTTVSESLTQDLGMNCDMAKLILHILVPEQKDFAGFEQWKRHWENCVRSQGGYYEGV